MDSSQLAASNLYLPLKPALEKTWLWQIGITAGMTLLALFTLAYAVRISRKDKNTHAIFIWLGGALAVAYEPLGDLLAHVTYHEVNQINLFSAFGFSIPIWLLPTYTIAVSTSVLWNLQRIKHGVSVKQWHTSFWLLIPIAVIFELPLLLMDAVAYFGPQPFSILGYPLAMAFTNTAGLIFTNSTLLYFLLQNPFIHRWPVLLILLVPMTTAGAHVATGLPWGLAMNATDNLAIINIMATLTMVFAVGQMWLCGQWVCKEPNQTHKKPTKKREANNAY